MPSIHYIIESFRAFCFHLLDRNAQRVFRAFAWSILVEDPGLEPGFTLLGLATYKDAALTIELVLNIYKIINIVEL